MYQRLTTPTHASGYLLRRKIASSLPDHIGELFRQAGKFNVHEETLVKLEALSAHSSGTHQQTRDGRFKTLHAIGGGLMMRE